MRELETKENWKSQESNNDCTCKYSLHTCTCTMIHVWTSRTVSY